MTARSPYRIGPRMIDALQVVSHYPGIVQSRAARTIGPHGSNDYGTRVLVRCYDAGLIERRRGDGNSWHLHLTARGHLALRAGEVTRDDIEALQREAAQAGDAGQAALCKRALKGAVGGPAWQRCAQVIAARRIESDEDEAAAWLRDLTSEAYAACNAG